MTHKWTAIRRKHAPEERIRCKVAATRAALKQETPYEVLVSDEFKDWYEMLAKAHQLAIERVVLMPMEAGPDLGLPYSSSDLRGRFRNALHELRIEHNGRPYRVLYMIDRSPAHRDFSVFSIRISRYTEMRLIILKRKELTDRPR